MIPQFMVKILVIHLFKRVSYKIYMKKETSDEWQRILE